MSAGFDYLPAEHGFLDPVRADAADPASARAIVIPFGLEASVSYGGGTAAGPHAILAASQQLELYDDEFGREPYLEYGAAAIREPAIAQPLDAALDQLAGTVEAVLAAGKFPFVLGGEHSLTAGAIRPFAARHKDLMVLQFDAHADLRDGYQGERNSHASAMRRVLDHPGVSLVSVGIRAVSTLEVEFYNANRDRITIHWAKDQARWNIEDIVKPLAGRPVYVTFDIDALDAAIMPATGTPTPGGLGYWQALAILRRACAVGNVVGADLVEFAPIKGFHAYDFTAAAIAYKTLSYALAKSGAEVAVPSANAFQIAVLPGDGIGPEVMEPCLQVLAGAEQKVGGFSISTTAYPAGAGHYRDHGEALPKATLDACRSADAILLAAMGLPSVRYPDGTEIAPQIDLRFDLGLYAGVRPVKTIPGLLPVLADPRAAQLDFVLVRESTEGLFATRGKGAVVNDLAATETLVITRGVSERLFDFCFELARQRKARGRPGHVTCVDKANVFAAFAFFRKVFEERAAKFPDIGASSAYVDATALDMVRRPWSMDVLVTENMFGDILSDLGAGLMGGMGMAPSADIGDEHAVFQPCHGTAPDIAGQGKANPTAMFLSGAMMLEWLGNKHRSTSAVQAARLIEAAVSAAYVDKQLRPFEMGGTDGTRKITAAVLAALAETELPL